MALLCAAEPDCMVPIGQTKACIYTPTAPNLTCHRQDQSLAEILRYNMEYRQQIEDPSFVTQLNPAHPRSSNRPLQSSGINGFFTFVRCQNFSGSAAEWLQKVHLIFQPNFWDVEACHKDLKIIGENNLTVHSKEHRLGCRSIFAKHPVLLKSNIFYFEISVKTMGSFIDFGFAVKQQTKLDEEIFDHKGNYAYESDGEIWISGEGKRINAEYSYGAGDTVGIAINLDTRQIIFTKNGLRLDFFLFDSPPTSADALPLFPFVSLYSFNDQIEANFGPNFKFDLTNF
ncbi:hypothetical protein niasHT_029870 [Heterodera trifolii]|uniref:B30.2/SPRY domain-containing protein n=1 Tax=Heterodera trifolii TaxID=157864 RepID=A0ABD2KB35_9BILA